jgi:S-DNA-T family DNA segregation ATPase FtsK/SpoIIIE
VNVVIRCTGTEYEVELDTTGEGETVGDVVASLLGLDDAVVVIDGRTVGTSVPLSEAGLGDGSTIEVAESNDPQGRARLIGIAGEYVGQSRILTAGTLSIGIDPADIVLQHAAGTIRIHTDNTGGLTMRNPEQMPVMVNGEPLTAAAAKVGPGARIEFAGSVFGLTSVAHESVHRRGVFNRPPRPVTRKDVTRLDLPRAPQEPAKAMRFGWGALIIPVVLGLSMAFLIHPRMAMFAIFSPAMLLANWFEDRRRVRKERKETGEAYRDALSRFGEEVAAAYRRDVEACRASATTPTELMARAVRYDSRLWERRSNHEDFMQVTIGTGCVPWQPELQGDVSP